VGPFKYLYGNFCLNIYMKIAFDLISDLHLEPDSDFNWTGQATSPVCVVAGDVGRDYSTVKRTLRHLTECYSAVFYIDGNDEHRFMLDNIGASYRRLTRELHNIKNLTFLQNNVVIIDGLAILGTNGWWGFDMDETIDPELCKYWMKNKYEENYPDIEVDTDAIEEFSRTDAAYLINSIQRLQTHLDVKKIAIITHTVPGAELIQHDIDLFMTPQFNCMGNGLLQLAHSSDSENKIAAWCFGHYHGNVDREINGVRYVNNCRGKGLYQKSVYYPKRIEIEI
jgi:UDP-2,3-diacylglucosamine pyrophosphatase LpxH